MGIMRWLRCAMPVVLLAAAGCDDASGPRPGPFDDPAATGSKAGSAPMFVHFADDAAPGTMQASFWAVRGQTRVLEIRYDGGGGGDDALLRFTVGANSLWLSPQGRLYRPGDSVQITVEVDPDRRFIFDFEPSGLQFSLLSPARLRINHSGADLGGLLPVQLGIWREEVLGLWLPLATVHLPGLPVVEAPVRHFTGFALAS